MTPYGHYPSKESLGETLKREDIKLISYEKHIIPWINECSKDKEVDGRLKYSLEMYHEILQIAINRSHYMNKIFEELKRDKSNLKLAIDIASTLQGRNYIKEFPEIKTFLKDVIVCIFGGRNPEVYFEPYDDAPIEKVYSITIDFTKTEFDFETWSIYCYENDTVYLSNDKKLEYTLFYHNDINNKLLQSLIIGDKETASEILRKELKKIYSFL